MKIGNRGQVLLVFVAALLALLGIAALGIDAGYMYTVRHELQRSADAGRPEISSACRPATCGRRLMGPCMAK